MIIRIKVNDKYILIGEGKNDLFYGSESELILKAGSFFEIINIKTESINTSKSNDFLVYYVDYISDSKTIDQLNIKFKVPIEFSKLTNSL